MSKPENQSTQGEIQRGSFAREPEMERRWDSWRGRSRAKAWMELEAGRESGAGLLQDLSE